MATTTGLVQNLVIAATSACVLIGPTPQTTELLGISLKRRDTAAQLSFKTAMIDALAQALVSRREVTASHRDNSASIESLTLR